MASLFLQLIGYFPQGFGITYIPRESTTQGQSSYEFAIVNRLKPKNPAEPLCRALLNLTYIDSEKI